jgi:hypothetical protein
MRKFVAVRKRLAGPEKKIGKAAYLKINKICFLMYLVCLLYNSNWHKGHILAVAKDT